MRKLAVVLALASTAIATPALARDKSWYVGVEGGGMIVEDIDYDIGAANNAGSVDHDYGYDVDGVMGYDFGGSVWKPKSATARQLLTASRRPFRRLQRHRLASFRRTASAALVVRRRRSASC